MTYALIDIIVLVAAALYFGARLWIAHSYAEIEDAINLAFVEQMWRHHHDWLTSS